MAETKGSVSAAQKRAAEKYTKANYDEIKVRVPKGYKAKIKAYVATLDNESVNSFINKAISAAMED